MKQRDMGAVLYVLLLSLLLLLLLPGYGSTEVLINKAIPSSWPWLASIFLDDRYRCEGALISSECVITISDCFGSFPLSHFTVSMGQRRLNLNYAEALSVVEELIPVPRSLVDNRPGSLVLVKLTQPPSISNSIYPTSLIKGPDFFPWKRICWAQGFKADFEDQNDIIVCLTMTNRTNMSSECSATDPNIPPDELWSAKMPLISPTNCQVIFQLQPDCPSPEISMPNGTQCTGPPLGSSEITVADGSPLLCVYAGQWVLLGVITWGPCSSNGLPEVYIPIHPISTWIQDKFPSVRVVKDFSKANLKSK